MAGQGAPSVALLENVAVCLRGMLTRRDVAAGGVHMRAYLRKRRPLTGSAGIIFPFGHLSFK
jgi:hypothetical protein